MLCYDRTLKVFTASKLLAPRVMLTKIQNHLSVCVASSKAAVILAFLLFFVPNWGLEKNVKVTNTVF